MRGEERWAATGIERLETIVREREWEPQCTVWWQTPTSCPFGGGRPNIVGGDGPLRCGKGDPRRTPAAQDQREGIPLARLALDGGLGQLNISGVPSHGAGDAAGVDGGRGTPADQQAHEQQGPYDCPHGILLRALGAPCVDGGEPSAATVSRLSFGASW